MNLARYTRQEANALEEHYLKGYIAEGLVGKGKVPANDNAKRGSFKLTPAGAARQERAKAAKERAYRLISEGYGTVTQVRNMMNCTDTPVRRYFRQLAQEGRIEALEDKPGIPLRWRIKPLPHLAK
jgi:hypothetical protein